MHIGWLVVVAGMAAILPAMAVRLDGKVRFPEEHSFGEALAAPADAEGFYSRAGAGRYRVRVEPGPQAGSEGPRRELAPYRVDPDAIYAVVPRQSYSPSAGAGASEDPADGTLDALQYCACVATPTCTPRTDLPNACGSGKVLCCYTKKPNSERQANSEVFNDIDDEQAAGSDRPYPSGPLHLGPEGSANEQRTRRPGPPVLVGPGGPTGVVGPYPSHDGLLEEADREALGAPSAQRGVLVGPGGPTGRIGPQPAILVGPGGPTGVIGPRGYGNGVYGNPYGNGRFGDRPSILVGPEGPTGLVGPARRPVLVGPGGPSGVVGPWYRQRGGQSQPRLAGFNGRFRADGERQRLYG